MSKFVSSTRKTNSSAQISTSTANAKIVHDSPIKSILVVAQIIEDLICDDGQLMAKRASEIFTI